MRDRRIHPDTSRLHRRLITPEGGHRVARREELTHLKVGILVLGGDSGEKPAASCGVWRIPDHEIAAGASNSQLTSSVMLARIVAMSPLPNAA
jgi:hypothetical protein